jgi:hypothetical protein
MHPFPCAFAVTALLLALPVHAGDLPLEAYAACSFGDELRTVSVVRAATRPNERPVETAAGERLVSVADGYRVMLALPGGALFANLKIERSVPGRYAQDKQAVLDQMHYLAGRAPADALRSGRRAERGIDIATIERRQVGAGMSGMVTFFDDAREVVATAYLMNGNGKKQPYTTTADFEAARSRFMDGVVRCLSGVDPR